MRHLVLFLLCSALACSSDAAPEPLFGAVGGSGGAAGASGPGAGGSTRACIPGKQEACACAVGAGFQSCLADGSGFNPCVCPGAGGASGSGTGTAGTGGVAAGGGTPGAGGGQGTFGDQDGDGWGPEQGDCADNDTAVNPGAFEVSGNGLDDDCDGAVDQPAATCDSGLGPVFSDPLDAAKAVGLCSVGVEDNPEDAKQRRPGVIAASFSDIAGAFLVTPPRPKADPAKQLGILPSFGEATQPQEGASLFALSSGNAKVGKDVCNGGAAFAANVFPPGFPKNGDCGSTGKPNDGIALDLKLRAPTNAKSFKVRFKFFTCEYPNYTCSSYNDIFAILMSPSPLAKGDPMSDGGENQSANVAFETSATGAKNVIGVNNTTFLSACLKDPQTPKYTSCGSEAGLKGSGFEGHAASAWLETQVPIPAFPAGADRVLSLRFAIWDSSDHILDSTTVVDGFQWSNEAIAAVVTSTKP